MSPRRRPGPGISALRDPADRLFAVPPREFVRARKSLATELTKAGRADAAAEVAALPKPTVAVWAINQVARQAPQQMRRLLETVKHLRAAHARGPAEVARAVGEQREALRELLRRAEQVLEAAGLRPTAQTHRRVSNTIMGAAVDRTVEADLRAGRLTEERAAPGFEALSGLRLVAPAKKPQRSSDRSSRLGARGRASTGDAGARRSPGPPGR